MEEERDCGGDGGLWGEGVGMGWSGEWFGMEMCWRDEGERW